MAESDKFQTCKLFDEDFKHGRDMKLTWEQIRNFPVADRDRLAILTDEGFIRPFRFGDDGRDFQPLEKD